MGSNGNHLILGNGAVHFNVPQIVCVVKHELQHPISRFGGAPTVFFGTVNNQTVIFGGLLELSVVVYSIVGSILDIVDDIEQVGCFMNQT